MYQPDFKTGDGWAVPAEENSMKDFDFDKRFEHVEKMQNRVFRYGSVFFVIAIIMALLMCVALALGVVWIWQHVHI